MSYELSQLSTFSTPDGRALSLEATPHQMEIVENVALSLGAERDSIDHHLLLIRKKNSEQILKAIEIAFKYVSDHYFGNKTVMLKCENKSIALVQDSCTNGIDTVILMLRIFGVEIPDNRVVELDKCLFNVLQTLIEQHGWLPCC